MQNTLYIIGGFIAGIMLYLIIHTATAAAPQCTFDATFNRWECCAHLTNGRCAVGADVVLLNN